MSQLHNIAINYNAHATLIFKKTITSKICDILTERKEKKQPSKRGCFKNSVYKLTLPS